jgi:23S rRNA pseudouridine1911/1915/1917 synthase
VHNTLVGVLRRQRDTQDWSLVHRIDRETSGVVLLARDRAMARELSLAFAAGEVRKTYLAVVRGRPLPEEGTIDRPIGPDQRSGIYVRRAVSTAGAPAVTDYTVIRSSGAFSLLSARPRTGRRHQIRVHLESIGHPIVGDKLYGGDSRWYLRALERGPSEAMLRALLAKRQLLHAAVLDLRHPADGRALTIYAPPPDDMREFLWSRGMDPQWHELDPAAGLPLATVERSAQRRSSTASTTADHGQ